jgi:hypothetical protein
MRSNTDDATFGREIIGQHQKIKRFFFAGLDCHNIQRENWAIFIMRSRDSSV